ncbi:MAG: YbaB/EbfC family nucleoid-associated protein [Chlamydia sp.]
MGTGFAKKKKQAKEFQSQMSRMQQTIASELSIAEVEGSAGNGLVTIILNGNGEMKRIRIQPECVDKEDIEGLEVLIKAAHTAAFKKVQELAESSSGMNALPDMSKFGF